MKKALLITSLKEDYYYRPFLAACRKRGDVEVFVFDTSLFPSEAKIRVSMTKVGVVNGSIDVMRMNARDGATEACTLDINDIAVAWYLRASPPEPKRMQTKPDALFSASEASGALSALWRVVPWRWINKRERIRTIQDNKLWQQQIAASVGLPVPYTLVSNDPAAHAALANQEGQVLCKTFGYIDLETKADLFVYSSLFGADEILASSTSIEGCPVFAQKYIPKRYEYRTMVIGERVLSCRIDSQSSDKTKVDWRHYDFENVAHEAHELSEVVNERLRMFMRAAKLKYGAIDLIETPDGEFVFLEVNPSGQWGWIAHYAGLPIPDTVAEMLSNG